MKNLAALLFFAIFGIGSTVASEVFEASAGFDSDTVQPFLERLNSKLGLDLDISMLVPFTESVPQDEEISRHVKVNFRGKSIDLEYRVFKDDPYAPDLIFFTSSKELASEITDQFRSFFEELGM